MNIEYSLTQSDLAAFNTVVRRRIAARAKPSFKLLVLNVVAWIPFGAAAADYLNLYRSYPHLASDLNFILLASAIAAVLIKSINVYRRKLLERAVYADENNRAEQSITADQSGLCVVAGDASSRCAWSSFTDCSEDDAALYLFLDVSHAVIVPKRAFRSTQELQQFLGWAKSSNKPIRATCEDARG